MTIEPIFLTMLKIMRTVSARIAPLAHSTAAHPISYALRRVDEGNFHFRRRTMKQIFIAMLALVMVASLAACGKLQGESSTPESSSSQPESISARETPRSIYALEEFPIAKIQPAKLFVGEQCVGDGWSETDEKKILRFTTLVDQLSLRGPCPDAVPQFADLERGNYYLAFYENAGDETPAYTVYLDESFLSLEKDGKFSGFYETDSLTETVLSLRDGMIKIEREMTDSINFYDRLGPQEQESLLAALEDLAEEYRRGAVLLPSDFTFPQPIAPEDFTAKIAPSGDLLVQMPMGEDAMLALYQRTKTGWVLLEVYAQSDTSQPQSEVVSD